MRPVAFPAFKAFGGVVTRAIAIIVDHVEDVALCPFLRHCVFIVRTVDVKVVVYAHIDVVIPTVEPGWEKKEGGRKGLTFKIIFNANLVLNDLCEHATSRSTLSVFSENLHAPTLSSSSINKSKWVGLSINLSL